MSTKATIFNNKKFHLYEEAYDNDNIYLNLDDLSGCCFEVWEEGEKTKSHVRMVIPIESWRKLTEAWNKSPWANNKSRDASKAFLNAEHLKRISDSMK